MMSKIQLMKPELANLIAAGEVIERPASVVKELVENSIDADSKNIYIGVLDGGRKKILVKDDGNGMNQEDARMCFLRHASSKIKNEYELNRIHTLGFRGEAIPSIASVSKVILTTSDGVEGTRVESKPDSELQVMPGPLRKGSIFEVSDLFFNTPARLKYLKSTQVENSNIIEVAEHLALGFPEISFSLFLDNRPVFNTSGRGDLLEAIQKIYGNRIALSLYKVTGEGIGFSFEGFVGKPEISYSRRFNMLTFLNNRCIYDYRINKAIEEAYRDYLPPLRYPFAIIKITADSQLVDVNVHPTKKEVRISIENEIANEIKSTLITVLKNKKPLYEASQDEKTSRDLNLDDAIDIEDFKADEKKKIDPDNTDRSEQKFYQEVLPIEPTYEAKNIVEIIKEKIEEQKPTSEEPKQTPKDYFYSAFEGEENKSKLPEMHPIGQVLNTYIICDSDDCFYLIDQHAAAERINYEKTQLLFSNIKERVIPLFPIVIELSFKESENFDEKHQRELEEIGIKAEMFGNRTLKITEIPAFLDDANMESIILDTVHSCLNDEVSKPLELLHLTIANIACKKSIKANHQMSALEMEGLLRDLSKCINPSNCPHGRPTIIRITKDDIEKIFRRTGF